MLNRQICNLSIISNNRLIFIFLPTRWYLTPNVDRQFHDFWTEHDEEYALFLPFFFCV